MGQVKDRFGLEADSTALVVVDMQERLMPAMLERLSGEAVKNTRLLIDGFKTLGAPILATEQYPKGLGRTVEELASCLEPIEKTSFSCQGEPAFVEALQAAGVKSVVLVGVETHVCVYQTAMDLLDKGYRVHVVRDGIASRFLSDYEQALSNIQSAGGVISTTEMVLFGLIRGAGSEGFKAISQIVRKR